MIRILGPGYEDIQCALRQLPCASPLKYDLEMYVGFHLETCLPKIVFEQPEDTPCMRDAEDNFTL